MPPIGSHGWLPLHLIRTRSRDRPGVGNSAPRRACGQFVGRIVVALASLVPIRTRNPEPWSIRGKRLEAGVPGTPLCPDSPPGTTHAPHNGAAGQPPCPAVVPRRRIPATEEGRRRPGGGVDPLNSPPTTPPTGRRWAAVGRPEGRSTGSETVAVPASVALAATAAPPHPHPERSGPRGRGVEGSPQRSWIAPLPSGPRSSGTIIRPSGDPSTRWRSLGMTGVLAPSSFLVEPSPGQSRNPRGFTGTPLSSTS